MEVDPLAERILLDLCKAFKKDPLVDEFDILPVEDSVCNKSPVVHLEHKIGLESWCIKHVYVYAYKNLFDWRQRKYKADPNALLGWTSFVLLINPDVQTAWNVRKELVSSKLHRIEEELRFSEVVLSHKPKSSECFAHRKWILLELIKSTANHAATSSIIEHEFFVCTQVASRYPNNYHAWSHRIWVVQNILNSCSKAVYNELEETENWVSTHVSDHSGFQYRQYLIHMLTSKISSPECNLSMCPFRKWSSEKLDMKYIYGDDIVVSVLSKELILVNDLILSFPGHETLWYHRRFIVFCMTNILKYKEANFTLSTNTANCIVSDDQTLSKKYKLETFTPPCCWSLAEEERFINHCLKMNPRSTWDKEVISRYTSWLKKLT